MKRDNELGQVAVLVLGLAAVAFAVAGIAIDGTRAMLFRRTLQDVADAAVLAGASAVDQDAYYRSGGQAVTIDAEAARTEVARILAARGIEASAQIDADVDGVSIVLRGDIPSTFLGVVGIESIPVAIEARAAPFEGAGG
jgi:hypothetical protein